MKTCTIICGLCIGWMVGMSASPVISNVITSILTVTITVTSVLGGFYLKATESNSTIEFIRKTKLDLQPVTLLVVAVTFGSCIGLYMRTRNILGTDKKEESSDLIQREIKTFTKFGLDKRYIAKRIFDSKYPPNSPITTIDSQNRKSNNANLGVLYSYQDSISEAENLCMQDTSTILRTLARSKIPSFRQLMKLSNKNNIVEKIHVLCDCH